MEIKKGIAVSPGLAIAPALVLDAQEFRITQRRVNPSDVPHELELLQKAIVGSIGEINLLRAQVAQKHGEETARIFDFHLGILNDPLVRSRMEQALAEQNFSAAYAVSMEMRRHVRDFLEINDQYFSERVKDVYDVERRLLRHLVGGRKEGLSRLKSEAIVVAHDLTPSQTASLDRTHVLAFATDAGGLTGHTAIVARALGIPAVVGLNDITADASPGDIIVVDGNRGVVILDPDEHTLEEVRQQQEEHIRVVQNLSEFRSLPTITRDDYRVNLLGNIEFPNEVTECIANGAEGIGLYRTEFLYLSREREPTEEEHYEAYVNVLEMAGERPVIIRTLDLGADKFTQARTREPERNPFLGCRSIRFCLRHLNIFKRQLRAILRASVKGNPSIMFPLITQLTELRQAKMILHDVMEDLEEEGIKFRRDIPIGVMIETPAAAIKAATLGREVDFFSIGTNDLIQYTLAVDRGNERVASLYTSTDPAVLRLIRHVIRQANRLKIGVSLCGEMAGQPEYALLLMGMGLKKFSMNHRAIPEIKQIIRSTTIEQAKNVARQAMRLETDWQILNYLLEETRKVLPGFSCSSGH
ncbi:MAG: phosphoenolpyruvate--protein phosphotransferase [Phycisphaerae bacterium]|nr:phosphoenolpyruvate--protein phosphotransferase [Phycisphaerae bacterium]